MIFVAWLKDKDEEMQDNGDDDEQSRSIRDNAGGNEGATKSNRGGRKAKVDQEYLWVVEDFKSRGLLLLLMRDRRRAPAIQIISLIDGDLVQKTR